MTTRVTPPVVDSPPRALSPELTVRTRELADSPQSVAGEGPRRRQHPVLDSPPPPGAVYGAYLLRLPGSGPTARGACRRLATGAAAPPRTHRRPPPPPAAPPRLPLAPPPGSLWLLPPPRQPPPRAPPGRRAERRAPPRGRRPAGVTGAGAAWEPGATRAPAPRGLRGRGTRPWPASKAGARPGGAVRRAGGGLPSRRGRSPEREGERVEGRGGSGVPWDWRLASREGCAGSG